MAAEAQTASNAHSQTSFRASASKAMTPINQKINPFETDSGLVGNTSSDRTVPRSDMSAVSAILMRKLPSNTTQEGLRTMLLFAKDFAGADFIPSDQIEDQGFLSAIARFRSPGAAQEAQSLLHGKQNNTSEPPLVVDILRLSPGSLASGANRFDMASYRANSNSSTTSTGGRSSRFNGTFQAIDRISPTNGVGGFSNTHPHPEASDLSSTRSKFFTPQSPIDQRQRVSGKAVIREDGIDDDPAEMLKDPFAYANGDVPALSRRSTNTTIPSTRFGNLSLATSNPASPPLPDFASSRGTQNAAIMSPSSISHISPNTPFQMPNQHYQRHNYPPVNPADQNPPCNTLYVGNLPLDTSEDELKSMFSKQRGYKRLCFRTKQNGPMCFVEFEDISFATKALNDLYGQPLHNSVKGGIRLSFSKNPLGVRTGQPGGGIGPGSPMSPNGPMNGASAAGFSTAAGPPPGLSAPPGLSSFASVNGMNGLSDTQCMPGMNNMMNPNNMGFGMNAMGDMGMGMNGMRGPGPQTAGWGQPNNQYGQFMYGR